MTSLEPGAHKSAAEAFAERVRGEYGESVDRISLYGSAARAETRGIDSDVDLLVVLQEGVDQTVAEDRLRRVAYDVELERGVVLSLIIMSAAEFDRESGRPFLSNVKRDETRLFG